ncbi:hypothetical protein OWR29_42225 [Actinoplanes sp. Pm04-4]|uniref:Biopterin-dependent aromatic amino acid hydroxylase family profile domain-containing protein n=1 Tax=Paractinoplanes pyxinae TaxID=2997416 RepID=A0ABT4BFC8_9ACTN|nr:hypothetical protein [Actinoplanes pyxinae]MCY1144657.1 hypothetical protein [Actinoplanes pyxinae]
MPVGAGDAGATDGAAGDVGEAGWRTGEIGPDVKPNEVRLVPAGVAGP